MKALKAIIILTLFFSCKNTNSSETPKNPALEVDTIVNKADQTEIETTLYALVDKLRLRKDPGSKGAVLEQIKEGERLLFLNEETDYKEKIKLRDNWHEEPWLKVQSEKGTTGWVFGGAVSKDPPEEDFSKSPYDDCDVKFVKDHDHEAKFQCYKKIESIQLEKDARYIKETETGYQITLLSGEKVNLVNEDGPKAGEEYKEYAYRFYLEKIGYFVFRIQRFEAGNFILMNDKFGYVMPVYGMPKLSPNLKKLVVTNADGDAGFEFNGIQLFDITEEGINPEPLFEEQFDNFEPHNPIWLDHKTIEFDFLSPGFSKKIRHVKAQLSENEEGKWDLIIRNRSEN